MTTLLPATPAQQFESPQEERLHRKQRLAASFRLFSKFGFDEGVAGHITARDPERTDHFWVNPFGMHFGQIRVSDLDPSRPGAERLRAAASSLGIELTFADAAFPFLTVTRQARSVQESLIALHELEADDRFFFRQTPPQLVAHIIRKAAAQGHSLAEKIFFGTGLRLGNERNQAIQRKSFPAHRRIGAHQGAEKAVFFGEYATDGDGGIEVQRLELPQMEETQDTIHIGTRQ